MDVLDFLNKNPALFSILAFPLGILLLALVGKSLGLGGLVEVMKSHIAVEVKIEERLQEFVNEIKGLVAMNNDNKRYYDERLAHFDDRFDKLEEHIQSMIILIPKRRVDAQG